MRRILIAGKNGQVGWELQSTLIALGEIVALDRSEMDLADPDSIRKCIREIKPTLIVNAAAYTAVDRAESEPDLARAVNGVAPGIMAEVAKRQGAALVHYSTDYVFDGTKKGSYTEEDTPHPLNTYGRSKLAGERAIQEVGCPHLIFRTSWVYGGRGKNFLLTILRLAREREEIEIVDDQFGAPTWSRHIAEATAQVLGRLCQDVSNDASRIAEFNGVYHLSAGGRTTWFGFAKEILSRASNLPHSASPRLVPISTEQYPTAATRPKNSVLDNGKLGRILGFIQPDWRTCLDMCLAQFGQ